jgi:hypothetical protein
LAGSTVFSLAGTTPLNSYFINILMWDSSYGNDLNGALAAEEAGAWFGSAAAGPGNALYGNLGTALSLPVGPSAGPGDPIYGTTVGFYGKSVVLLSPEPATLAIGGLGAAALLLFRRRK